MFKNLTVADGSSSRIKKLTIDGQPLTVEINAEISGICVSKCDKLKLSLIKSDDSKYFNYIEHLSDKLMSRYENFLYPISQQKYTKLNIDLDRSKVVVKGSKYPLGKSAIKELFECHQKVSGKIKFYLYHCDNEIFLIYTVDTLTVDEEVL